MNLSTLLQPPKAPPEPPESDRDVRPRTRERVRQRMRRHRRAFALGVLASVLAHVLVFVVSPLFIRYVDSIGSLPAPPPPFGAVSPEGTRVIDLVVTETPEPEPPSEEEPVEVEEEPEPVAAAPGTEAPAGEAEAETEAMPTAAERLRPRVGDWRLWVSPPLATRELTPAERDALLRERVYAEIEAYNDSAAAEAARRAAAMDWTIGEEGNRWGVEPGKIHLGPITLPLPFNLGPHPSVQRDQEREQAEWEAIQRQAGQGAIDESFEDRVKAIRERNERERAREKAEEDSTSNR